jgi:Tfp pilus assembly protein PilF
MSTSKPILAAVATLCLLQGCVTPPAPPPAASRAMKTEPLLQVQNAGSQSAATYYQLGKFHQERGNKEAARAAYVQSIGLDRRQIEARNALAVLHSEDGQLEDARVLLTQLVQDYPRVAYLHNNLAYVHLLRGEPDAAVPALKNALALDPSNARALINLGLVQTAMIERRNRLTAALGLADVIVGRTALAVETPAVVAAEPATVTVAVTRQAPVAAPAVAPSPVFLMPQSAQSSMEVVQVLPNVIELRQRQPAPVAVAERRQEKNDVVVKPVEAKFSDTKPAEAKSLAALPSQPRPFRFDVANGNGISGMALKMRDALALRGIVTARVSNKKPYTTKNTEIFYLAGYEKEAERVRSALAANVTLTSVPSIAGMQEVQLVLGKDAARYTAPINKGMLVAYHETSK